MRGGFEWARGRKLGKGHPSDPELAGGRSSGVAPVTPRARFLAARQQRINARNPFPAFMLMVCALAAFSVLRPYIHLGSFSVKGGVDVLRSPHGTTKGHPVAHKSKLLSAKAAARLRGSAARSEEQEEEEEGDVMETTGGDDDSYEERLRSGSGGAKAVSGSSPKMGEVRGPWKWGGDVWRRIDPEFEGADPQNNPLSWFDRRTVQSKLDFDKYIDCAPRRSNDTLPGLDGLPVRSKKVQLNDFIVHQGNYVHFGKGPTANRTDRIVRVGELPLDGENTLRAMEWGRCAVVGNSGVLKLTEFARAIDSHDTVLRLNMAPTVGYARRVGHKTTHRLLNRLWTRTYRNGRGMKKGDVLPMEQDVVFLVSRATSQEYELLFEWAQEVRPDVRVMYVSSRAASMSQPFLSAYRNRLCRQGWGPYKGLLVPSSGLVVVQMMQQLCDVVDVYGFGVKGMGNCHNCGFSKSEDQEEGERTQKFMYHYYKGTGSRHVGDDVHSFDTEEKVLSALGRDGYINICTYQPPFDNENNWACGCASDDKEKCRPFPRLHPERPDDDSDEDCGPDGCEVLFRLGPHPLGPGFEDETMGGAGGSGAGGTGGAAKHKGKGMKRSKAAAGGAAHGGSRTRDEHNPSEEDFLQDWR